MPVFMRFGRVRPIMDSRVGVIRTTPHAEEVSI
jgi:hypothetical protein